MEAFTNGSIGMFMRLKAITTWIWSVTLSCMGPRRAYYVVVIVVGFYIVYRDVYDVNTNMPHLNIYYLIRCYADK